jgi:hypothetical protein
VRKNKFPGKHLSKILISFENGIWIDFAIV